MSPGSVNFQNVGRPTAFRECIMTDPFRPFLTPRPPFLLRPYLTYDYAYVQCIHLEPPPSNFCQCPQPPKILSMRQLIGNPEKSSLSLGGHCCPRCLQWFLKEEVRKLQLSQWPYLIAHLKCGWKPRVQESLLRERVDMEQVHLQNVRLEPKDWHGMLGPLPNWGKIFFEVISTLWKICLSTGDLLYEIFKIMSSLCGCRGQNALCPAEHLTVNVTSEIQQTPTQTSFPHSREPTTYSLILVKKTHYFKGISTH